MNIDQRVEDLLSRMGFAEKAGMLFQTMIVIGSGDLSKPNSAFRVSSAEYMIKEHQLSHFNVIRAADDARTLAEWQNRLQKLAASTRLGIPVTLSTDPRHHFTENVGTAAAAVPFRSGRRRSGWQRSAPPNSCNASATSLAKSIWRSAFGSPYTLKLILLLSPAGLGSTAASEKTQTSRAD